MLNKLIIFGLPQDDAPCEYCGTVTELRPYGKNGAKICYECGMKPENIEQTDRAIDEVLSGKTVEVKPVQSN